MIWTEEEKKTLNEFKHLSNSELLEKIKYSSWKQGYMDAKVRACKHGSPLWNERVKEFEEIGLLRVYLDMEYYRRFCGVNYEDYTL